MSSVVEIERAIESLPEKELAELRTWFGTFEARKAKPATTSGRSADTGDEWERRLFGAAVDCGVSVSHHDLSSVGLYE